jgi:hypothetical protein
MNVVKEIFLKCWWQEVLKSETAHFMMLSLLLIDEKIAGDFALPKSQNLAYKFSNEMARHDREEKRHAALATRLLESIAMHVEIPPKKYHFSYIINKTLMEHNDERKGIDPRLEYLLIAKKLEEGYLDLLTAYSGSLNSSNHNFLFKREALKYAEEILKDEASHVKSKRQTFKEIKFSTQVQHKFYSYIINKTRKQWFSILLPQLNATVGTKKLRFLNFLISLRFRFA